MDTLKKVTLSTMGTSIEEVIEVPECGGFGVNPFYHRIILSPVAKIRVALFTVLVLPVRLVGIILFLFTAWFLSVLGTWGVTEKELRDGPLSGVRRSIGQYMSFVARLGFWIFGLHVTVKGQQASRKEAPVLVVAPHSSFADLAVGLWMGLPHLICRSEESRSCLIGSIMNYCQPIYVAREDPNSRQNTLKEIIRRATSTLVEWRQILVFPEGTCSNRKALLTFKPGGFYPAVPVQPVCLHYTDELDTITWTWDGPGALKILWLTMTKISTNLIIEFLPPIVPNEKECLDPNLFAENTRLKMASHLGVPVVSYSFDDAQLAAKAAELGLPSHVGLIEARVVKIQNRIDQRFLRDEILERFSKIADRASGIATLQTFACRFAVPESDAAVATLFRMFDVDANGYVTFKQYIAGYVQFVRPSLSEKNLSMHYEGITAAAQVSSRCQAIVRAFDISSIDNFKAVVLENPELMKYLEVLVCPQAL